MRTQCADRRHPCAIAKKSADWHPLRNQSADCVSPRPIKTANLQIGTFITLAPTYTCITYRYPTTGTGTRYQVSPGTLTVTRYSTCTSRVLAMAENAADDADERGPGYHYWHDKVAQGDSAAPQPQHTPLAVDTVAESAPPLSVDSFAFLDDDDVVKVYIKLEGDLAEVTTDSVTLTVEKARYDTDCSMDILVKGKQHTHRLHAEKLMHEVVPDQCKFKVSAKNSKIIVTLKKKMPGPWEGLRARHHLPYRKGGGG